MLDVAMPNTAENRRELTKAAPSVRCWNVLSILATSVATPCLFKRLNRNGKLRKIRQGNVKPEWQNR